LEKRRRKLHQRLKENLRRKEKKEKGEEQQEKPIIRKEKCLPKPQNEKPLMATNYLTLYRKA